MVAGVFFHDDLRLVHIHVERDAAKGVPLWCIKSHDYNGAGLTFETDP
jgi:hypothetical protein